ncbi:iron complex outermembrane recepter protein [Mucilaginibacter mallensis]|uniref:Iron complex outermembrane recepter protein n=1 Tax=Mucilaginibacter mallensis TaxID=652787 RepID=A0A1H2C2F2_MUCMA|nr:TonB-dependent receptor [Mucilaginibacter mallensis]SDT64176.1 iron complex outermembrane recepter protein [Mucilaginibacter mallensis]
MKIIKRLSIAIYTLLFITVATKAIAKAPPEDTGNGTLKGTVTDKAGGITMPGVTVSIPDLRIGTATNSKGQYILNHVSKGVYLVTFTFVGYTTYTEKVDFSKTSELDVQLNASSIETSEVVVTGVSRATEIKRDPVPMAAINKTFIDQHSASGNVIDEIANLPGVSAVTTGPNISKPFIHGLGYNRVVTLEDGIRQEGQQWGDEHGIEVDQNSIDRVEVIKGPASLSYGSDAIGGVVNLLTPPPVPDGKILGDVQGVYGTNNGLINGSFRLQGNNNGLVWGTVISDKEAKDYQNQHDGRVYATNFKEKDARAMIGLNKSWGYSYLNASIFDDEQAIPDGSRDSLTRQFTKQITDADTYRPVVPASELNSYDLPVLHQHVQLYRIYDNSNFIIGNGNLIVNLGYQYSHRREFTHPEDADIPGLNLQLTTYTYDVKYNFNIAKTYETTIGVNGMYQNNTLGYSTDFPIPAYHQFDIGPFFVVKKSFGKLDLSGGARYDTRSFTGKAAYIDNSNQYFPTLYTGANPTTTPNVTQQFSALSKTFSGASGSFGATYNFSDKFLLKGNIARGFRAPSIAELSANGPDPGSQIYHVGNSDFKPEFSVQEDLGAFLTLPNISASVEVFNNDIQNYIFQEQILDANGNPEYVNSSGQVNPNGQQYAKFTYVQSKARINGGEVSLDIHPVSWLHFENELTLTYGQNLGTGSKVPDSLKYLPFIPPLHTHSELRGTLNKGFGSFKQLYAFVGFDHYDAQNRFFAAYGTETYTAGYNLLSAGIGGNLNNAAGKTVVKLFIEGTNLANVNYQSNMSRLKYFDNAVVPAGVQPGIFNMGRNISFKVVVPFDLSPHAKDM